MATNSRPEPKSGTSGLKPPKTALAISWIAQVLQIISGFLVPRIIDHQMGREMLGVWDFGWSLITYFSLVEGGISSSVNRHVALHLAENDMGSVNRVVSSVAMLQRGIGVAVLILSVAAAFLLPFSFLDHNPALKTQCRYVIGLLGASLCFSISGSVYGGIITGRRAWNTHHGIFVCTNILSLAGMYFAVTRGYGLAGLAIVHASTEVLGRVARAVAAYRLVQGLEIRLSLARWSTAKSMISYGGLVFLGRVSQIVMNQTVNVMIASQLGPAALALFSRPRALVRQVAVFPQKYANMLVPAAATLSASNNPAEMRRFAVESTRDGLYVALPLLCFLIVCGSPLMRLWMGDSYGGTYLVVIMALGSICEVAYQPLNSVLFGLDLHGRPAIASVIGALASIACAWFALHGGGKNLELVAIGFSVPWLLAGGLYIPVYACDRLGMSLSTFLREVWIRPLLCIIPFSLAAVAGRMVSPASPLWTVVISACCGGVVLLATYWRYVLPEAWKRSLLRRLLGKVPGAQMGSGSPATLKSSAPAADQASTKIPF